MFKSIVGFSPTLPPFSLALRLRIDTLTPHRSPPSPPADARERRPHRRFDGVCERYSGHLRSTCTEHSRAELYTPRMKPRPVYALHDSSQAVLSLPPETFGHSDSSQVHFSLLPTATILYLVRSTGADRAKTTARLFTIPGAKWSIVHGARTVESTLQWPVQRGVSTVGMDGSPHVGQLVHVLYTVLRPGHPAH